MFYFIYVELTSMCNMSCEFCTYSTYVRAKGHMDFGFFKNIINQIAEHKLSEWIYLAAIGESLLYPRLLDAIEYCAKKNLYTNIITNALTLTTELYEELAKSGLRNLYISLHNMSEESFAYRHALCKTDYVSYYRNIMEVLDFHVGHHIEMDLNIALLVSKKKWISTQLWDLPEIKKDTENIGIFLEYFTDEINQIARKHNARCCLNKKEFISRLRAVNILSSSAMQLFKNVYLTIWPLNPQLYNTRRALQGPLGEKIRLLKTNKGHCPSLQAPMVLCDGSFIPCCRDGLEEVILGKIDSEHSLLSVLKSNTYRHFIQEFERGNIIHPVCQECMGKLVYRNPLSQMKYLMSSWDMCSSVERFISRCRRFVEVF